MRCIVSWKPQFGETIVLVSYHVLRHTGHICQSQKVLMNSSVLKQSLLPSWIYCNPTNLHCARREAYISALVVFPINTVIKSKLKSGYSIFLYNSLLYCLAVYWSKVQACLFCPPNFLQHGSYLPLLTHTLFILPSSLLFFLFQNAMTPLNTPPYTFSMANLTF